MICKKTIGTVTHELVGETLKYRWGLKCRYRYIDLIVGFDANIFNIFSRDVLKRIGNQDLTWEEMVPVSVAQATKRRGIFGHGHQQGAKPEPQEVLKWNNLSNEHFSAGCPSYGAPPSGTWRSIIAGTEVFVGISPCRRCNVDERAGQ
jgi:hypothetical protein